MSADVWIVRNACTTCKRGDGQGAELNITYNLTPMLRKAGFCGWGELVGMQAKAAGQHIPVLPHPVLDIGGES